MREQTSHVLAVTENQLEGGKTYFSLGLHPLAGWLRGLGAEYWDGKYLSGGTKLELSQEAGSGSAAAGWHSIYNPLSLNPSTSQNVGPGTGYTLLRSASGQPASLDQVHIVTSTISQ